MTERKRIVWLRVAAILLLTGALSRLSSGDTPRVPGSPDQFPTSTNPVAFEGTVLSTRVVDHPLSRKVATATLVEISVQRGILGVEDGSKIIVLSRNSFQKAEGGMRFHGQMNGVWLYPGDHVVVVLGANVAYFDGDGEWRTARWVDFLRFVPNGEPDSEAKLMKQESAWPASDAGKPDFDVDRTPPIVRNIIEAPETLDELVQEILAFYGANHE